jgi:2-iminobutanoate/2-iminopropanoate deaminase
LILFFAEAPVAPGMLCMTYRTFLFALIFSVLPACSSETPAVQRECFHLEAYEQDVGYCQAVRVGDTLHVSGTAAEGEMPAAVRAVYDTIRKTLLAHGLDFKDVVRETVFTTDLDAFIATQQLRKEYYGGEVFPAASWVQVQRLYLPSQVVEIEVTAVFPADG